MWRSCRCDEDIRIFSVIYKVIELNGLTVKSPSAKASAFGKGSIDTKSFLRPSFACKVRCGQLTIVPALKMSTVASDNGLSRLSSARLTAV